ncbi:lysophospholipid acyltransferase family protein [Mucilaginibacter paludis]|uniref:Lipid A biosynthesis acyltransferase n=1 Tax=Mucilaginibacter paludis DSM 18603 TaxID=714943 RepID=H1Y3C6_9SPHI|nr:lysophospholipid acyltransferase family protein [Mucilaginibacter paludis]EHQ29281.1 lipid A biosynthesis acyltransferase [Mucilaginibacter paludis DSM 18603]
MIKAGLSRIVFFFLYLLSLLPFWFLYLLADGIYIVLYKIIGYRREVVYQNLINSFPGKGAEEIKVIEKKYYRYLADLIVETIKMISISANEVKRRMKATNPELVTHYYNQNKSIIAAVAHYGNWEMAAHRFSLIPEYQKIIVYKPLSNKRADQYYQQIRGRFGAMLVPMKSTLRKLAALKNELTFTVLVSDQTPVQHEAQYFTRFLNQPTALFLGVEKMAVMFDTVVVFADVRCVKRGYYEYKIVTLFDYAKQTQPYEITDTHTKYLEEMINREPQYWLWSHRRWKFKPEGAV